MDERDNEILRSAVGEYLEALDRLERLQSRMLRRGPAKACDLAAAWTAAVAVRKSLRGLRITYAASGESTPAVVDVEPVAVERLANAVPAPLNQWPLRSGQRV